MWTDRCRNVKRGWAGYVAAKTQFTGADPTAQRFTKADQIIAPIKSRQKSSRLKSNLETVTYNLPIKIFLNILNGIAQNLRLLICIFPALFDLSFGTSCD